MSIRREVRLYVLQRLSAAVLAPLVIVHIAIMINAVQGGLSAGEMLARVQNNAIWPLFYGMFYVAAGVHAAIGLRGVLREITGVGPLVAVVAAWAFLILVLALGVRAMAALT